MIRHLVALAERGWIPDFLIRVGIRRLVAGRLREIDAAGADAAERTEALVRAMSRGPVAVQPDRPNEQHYEVPAAFFERVLGPQMKYSCCHWPRGISLLAEAESAMLERTCERAGVADGQKILDLGCGWGSLTLWMARRYPNARITAVSNSNGQRRFIAERCRALGLGNVQVVTADMNEFTAEGRFDRILSIEMFEHMRNYRELLGRIASWLKPDGRLFVHVFCHRSQPYLFEIDDDRDWMARHFFTAGLMPSADLLARFQEDLVVERQWEIDGRHYEKTALAWLERLDAASDACREILADVYGQPEGTRWLQRWRIFFLACAELFAFRDGREWFVSHSLLRHRSGAEEH